MIAQATCPWLESCSGGLGSVECRPLTPVGHYVLQIVAVLTLDEIVVAGIVGYSATSLTSTLTFATCITDTLPPVAASGVNNARFIPLLTELR